MAVVAPPGPTGSAETPFTRGRAARTDELGERTVIARNWRYLTYGIVVSQCLLLAVLLVLVQQPQYLPVYIERDPLTGAMQQVTTGSDYSPHELTIQYELRQFVTIVRSVSTDKRWMQRAWSTVFAKVTEKGHRQLAAYAIERDPLHMETEIWVEVQRVVKHGEQTYDLRWTETRPGTHEPPQTYSGLFTWSPRRASTPLTVKDLTQNPSGVYLDTWGWSVLP